MAQPTADSKLSFSIENRVVAEKRTSCNRPMRFEHVHLSTEESRLLDFDEPRQRCSKLSR